MKKIFTFLVALILSIGMGWSRMPLRRQVPVNVANCQKAIQQPELDSEANLVEIVSASNASKIFGIKRLPNKRNTAGNYYANSHGDYAFTLSQTSTSKVSDGRMRLHAYADESTYEYEADIDFFVPAGCDYIPSANYCSTTTGETWTVRAGSGLSDPYSYFAITNWNQSKNYWYLFSDDDSYGNLMAVVNPKKENKPIYAIAIATAVSSGYQAWVTFGTEPAFRTVIVSETVDANGNYLEGQVDLGPVSDKDWGDDDYWEGTTVTIIPHLSSGWIVAGFTGAGSEDVVANGDGTYSFVVGAKNYNISAMFKEAVKYTISTSVDGLGNVSGGGELWELTMATLTATPNSGNSFVKWLRDGEDFIGNTSNPLQFSVTKNETYTAVFKTMEDGTITVLSNNEDWGSAMGGGHYGAAEKVTIKATANDQTYRFVQWNDGNTDNPRTIVVDGDATYTATFESAVDFSFTWDMFSSSQSKGSSIYINQWYKVPSTSTKPCMQLVFKGSIQTVNGKNALANGTYTFSNSTNGNNKVAAYRWVISNSGYYCLYYDASNTKYYLNSGTVTVSSGANNKPYIIVNALGGTTTTGTDRPFLITVGEPKRYRTITINPTVNGVLIVKDGTKTVNNGDKVEYGHTLTVTATPDEHYQFNAWTNDGAASVTVDADKTIGATFVEKPKYTITFKNGETVLDEHLVESGVMPAYQGEEPTKESTASTVYTFARWEPALVVAEANKTYQAIFDEATRQYTVTLACTPEDKAQVALYSDAECTSALTQSAPDEYTVDYGTTVYAKATNIAEHYHFQQWTGGYTEDEGEGGGDAWDAPIRRAAMDEPGGDLEGGGEFDGIDDNPLTVEVKGYVSLTAHIVINRNMLTWNTDGGTITSDESEYTAGLVAYGTMIDVPEVEKAGFNFKGWDPEVDLTMPDHDVTYTAQWEEAYREITLTDGADAVNYCGTGLANKVTLNREFPTSSWSTICLPFYVNEDNMYNAGLNGKIYDFISATGNATVGMTLYFKSVDEMEAGVPYLFWSKQLVRNPWFEDVEFMADADEVGTKVSAKINMVGTVTYEVHNKTNDGVDEYNKIMGLSKNKIYYAPSTGVNVRAYRAYFRLNGGRPSIAPRIRIVTEDMESELEIVNDELVEAQDVRKYVENGVLVIERNGIRYTAQGARID